MLKKYSPETLYSASMWLVSLLFAGFLITLGGKILGDMPKVNGALKVEQFVDQAQLKTLNDKVALYEALLTVQKKAIDDASSEYARLDSTASNAKQTYDVWLSTRRAIDTNPKAIDQDVEGLSRMAYITELYKAAEAAKIRLDNASEPWRQTSRSLSDTKASIGQLMSSVSGRFESAQRWLEFWVFLERLAIVLPLVMISMWLLLKKRKSRHWPLARGFILFSLNAFTFEIIPYLPSYGGYVRAILGIVLCIFGGHYGMVWMQAFLVRRRAEQERNEMDRRQTMDRSLAIGKINAQLCPGCERALIASSLQQGAEFNNCVFCGLKLFDRCQNPSHQASDDEGVTHPKLCLTRKNAFFPFCPTCGGASEATKVSQTPPKSSGLSALPSL